MRVSLLSFYCLKIGFWRKKWILFFIFLSGFVCSEKFFFFPFRCCFFCFHLMGADTLILLVNVSAFFLGLVFLSICFCFFLVGLCIVKSVLSNMFLFLRDRCVCWFYSWLVWWASLCLVTFSVNRKLRYKSAYFVKIFNIFFPMIRDSLCVSGNVSFNFSFYEIQLHLLCFLFSSPFFVFWLLSLSDLKT